MKKVHILQMPAEPCRYEAQLLEQHTGGLEPKLIGHDNAMSPLALLLISRLPDLACALAYLGDSTVAIFKGVAA